MLNKTTPKSGSLLLSEPFMIDLNFKRSVVLLTEHNEEGSLGFVLNQRSDFLLKELLADCGNADFPVYIGGPVGSDTLHFIHRCHDRMNSGTEIIKGVYWGGNFEALKLLLNNELIEADEIKFFMGYSGWNKEQLVDELEQNSWLTSNTYSDELLFLNNEENLWKEILIGLGPKYAHIARFPENPMWN